MLNLNTYLFVYLLPHSGFMSWAPHKSMQLVTEVSRRTTCRLWQPFQGNLGQWQWIRYLLFTLWPPVCHPQLGHEPQIILITILDLKFSKVGWEEWQADDRRLHPPSCGHTHQPPVLVCVEELGVILVAVYVCMDPLGSQSTGEINEASSQQTSPSAPMENCIQAKHSSAGCRGWAV